MGSLHAPVEDHARHAAEVADAIRTAARLGQAFSVTAYARARGWTTGGGFSRAFQALHGMTTISYYEACAHEAGSR